MEDGTVSILGLVCGVAATTTDSRQVLIAGASGAVAAAVSMMGGAYLEAETQQDLGATGAKPFERSLWMLASDFVAAAVPIAPFAFLSVPSARICAAATTMALLVILGAGRAWLGLRPPIKTIAQTVAIGVAAALLGVGVATLFARFA